MNAIEFGSGTGNLTVSLIERACFARVLMLDHSVGMLEAALEKARRRELRTDQVAAIESSILESRWKGVDGFAKPDVVVFQLSLDHVEHDAELRTLFADIFNGLSAGGALIISEKCADGSAKDSASWKSFVRMVDLRARHMLTKGLMSTDQVEAWQRHLLDDDILRPLSALQAFAVEAGFRIAEIHGVELRPAEVMTYENYYRSRQVNRIMPDDPGLGERAFGIGILCCVKDG
jgi:2-polyprenyl-3-methyl-5-hydroxy-6-metoxy-1,4-benzoquinol methylase